jgi:uncharacterized membrane protein
MTPWIVAGAAYVALVTIITLFTRAGARREHEYWTEIERRIARDELLREAYARLEAELGRPPTTRELWGYAPPDLPE